MDRREVLTYSWRGLGKVLGSALGFGAELRAQFSTRTSESTPPRPACFPAQGEGRCPKTAESEAKGES